MEEMQFQGDSPNARAPKKKRIVSIIFSVLGWVSLITVMLSILTAAWGFSLFWHTQISGVKVSGTSMQQTFQDGDVVLMQKIGPFHQADYGDVIIVNVEGYDEWQSRTDKLLIKRLIAKAGDSVKCINGIVYLKKSWERDYTAIDEPYAYYGTYQQNYDFGEYVLGEGEIFFLGDNRSSYGSSQDSRWKEGHSQLNYLYKVEDIIGTVPQWAITYQEQLEQILFGNK